MPVRLQWVRSTRISGTPDSNKQVQFGNDGYKVATTKDVGAPWLKELPAGSTVMADGSIVKGDTVLMVCDNKTAAKNSAMNQREINRLARSAPSELIRVGATDPTYESTPGPQIAAPKSAIKA